MLWKGPTRVTPVERKPTEVLNCNSDVAFDRIVNDRNAFKCGEQPVYKTSISKVVDDLAREAFEHESQLLEGKAMRSLEFSLNTVPGL